MTTAVSRGMRVFPVQTTDEAAIVASTLENPLLVGELGGNLPYGFDLTNSPHQIALWQATERPIVFISSSGSQLLRNATGARAVYISCFRNLSAVAKHLSEHHPRVAVLGAGTRGEFRHEDQMGCAWLAQKLLAAGYEAENQLTRGYIARWDGVGPQEIEKGKSADYLRETGQTQDLEYVVSHFDDLNTVPALVNGELLDVGDASMGRRSVADLIDTRG